MTVPLAEVLPGPVVSLPERYGEMTLTQLCGEMHQFLRDRHLRPFEESDNRLPGFESEMQVVFPRRADDGRIPYFTYVVREAVATGGSNTPVGASRKDRAG